MVSSSSLATSVVDSVKVANMEHAQHDEAQNFDVESQNSTHHFKESDAGDGTKHEEHLITGFPLVLCGISCCLCLFLVALDQTIVFTILSTIADKFDGFSKIGWLSSGFLLAMAVFVVIWGKIAIIFGRKYTMFIAIILFEIGSLICALANSMDMLIGGRVLAGIGGSGIQSLTFIIVSEVVTIDIRPLFISSLSIGFVIASVAGPLLGGAFTSNVSWRWCFYINLPIGGIAFITLALAFHPPKPKGNLLHKLLLIDYPGMVLMTASLVIFLLALTFGSDGLHSWDSPLVIVCFVVGIVLFIVFCVWNFIYSKHPVIPWAVVKVPQISAASLTLFCGFGYFTSNLMYISIYFQVVRGDSAIGSGIAIIPCIISVVLSSLASGILVGKTRFIKPFVVLAYVVGFIGNGLLLLLDVHSNVHARIGLMILPGISIGLMMQPLMISGQVKAPKTESGTILTTAYINFSRSFGGAIAADLADAVYAATLTNSAKATLSSASESVKQQIETYGLKNLATSASLLKSMSTETQDAVKLLIMKAIYNIFYMGLGFTALGFISCFFITNRRLPAPEKKKKKDKKDKKGKKGKKEEEEDSNESNEENDESKETDETQESKVTDEHREGEEESKVKQEI